MLTHILIYFLITINNCSLTTSDTRITCDERNLESSQ